MFNLPCGALLNNRYFDSIIIFLNSLVSYKNDRSGKRKLETASEEEGLSQ